MCICIRIHMQESRRTLRFGPLRSKLPCREPLLGLWCTMSWSRSELSGELACIAATADRRTLTIPRWHSLYNPWRLVRHYRADR
jgi:hypothetical protein